MTLEREILAAVEAGDEKRLAELEAQIAARPMRERMERLREECGVRLVGTSDQATTGLYETDLTGPLAIVMGGEEAGLRRLTTENCDELIRIPMLGEVPCLNVSAATAVCLFEAVRQRGGFLP